MTRPTDDQILTILDGLQKGDHLALRWEASATPDRCCVIYLRVSSKRQLDGEGLGDQWRACMHYAAREGLEIAGLYVDPAISGRKEHRPAIDKLKRDTAGRRFRTVLFFKVNRVGRNARASYETAEEIERHGLAVVSATESFRRGTAAGNLTFGMLVTVAQFGSDQLSEVMKTRLQYKAQCGLWVGPVPYGCVVLDRILRAGPGIGVVEQVWRQYESGQHSYTSIADELNSAGHRTQRGTYFGRESVRTLLKSRAYAGWVASGDEYYPGAHGELFPDATKLWEKNQELMRRRTSEHTMTNTTHRTSSPAFLTGLLYCEHCGGKLWHHYGGRGGSLRYLICSGKSQRICTARQIRADSLEAQALAIFQQLSVDEETLAKVLARIEAQRAVATPPRAINPATILAKLQRLAMAFTDEVIDERTYIAERDRLKALLAEANTGPIALPPPIDISRAATLLRGLPHTLASAQTPELRAVSAALVNRLWVADGQIIGVSPTRDLYPVWQTWAEMHNTPPSEREGGVSGGVPDGFQVDHTKPEPPYRLFLAVTRQAA